MRASKIPPWWLAGVPAIATLAICIIAAGPWRDGGDRSGSGAWILAGFLLWAMSPYAGVAGVLHLAGGRGVWARRVASLGALGIALAGLWMLYSSLFESGDAQAGLAVLTVPAWQWPAVAMLALACVLFPRSGDESP